MRRLALATLIALSAAACERRAEQPAEPATPAAAGPLSYERTIPTAEVSLKLPDEVGAVPALRARLYDEERAALDAFADKSVEEVEGLRKAGLPARPYSRSVAYAFVAQTPKLISLTATRFEDTGGAHPNTALSGLIWDKAANKAVTNVDLFAKGADMARADAALCDAIKAEKRRRIGDDSFTSVFTGCPALASAQLVLRPSTTAGKAGGLTALFSPYDIGPYVEGAYEIDVPQSALQGVIAPAYAVEFAGAPTPRPAGG